MTVRPCRGDVPLTLGDREVVMRFDWDALDRLHAAYGDDYNLDDLDTLAGVTAIGLACHHPEITASAVRDARPAVMPTAERVLYALNLAYLGPEKAEAVAREPDGAKKKRTGPWWRVPFGRRFGRGSTPSGSGA